MIPSAPARRPKFTESFPKDAELDRLVDAFTRGNHRLVRDEAEALAKRANDPAVAAAARELRRRLDPDPIAYVLLATTAILLVALTLWAIRQSKRYDAERPAAPPTTVQVAK